MGLAGDLAKRTDVVVCNAKAVAAFYERAGLPREAHEGPLSYTSRASARWPDYAIAFGAIGEAYAKLRYARVAPRERNALVATLQRAVEVLPAPAALRRAA